MCIICNCVSDPGPAPEADAFLTEFDKSRKAMKAAAEAMLAVSKVAVTPEARARYARTHKMMVKLRRQWNALEQFRELSE